MFNCRAMYNSGTTELEKHLCLIQLNTFIDEKQSGRTYRLLYTLIFTPIEQSIRLLSHRHHRNP